MLPISLFIYDRNVAKRNDYGYDERCGKILCANSIHCCWPIHKIFEEKTGGKFTTFCSLRKMVWMVV